MARVRVLILAFVFSTLVVFTSAAPLPGKYDQLSDDDADLHRPLLQQSPVSSVANSPTGNGGLVLHDGSDASAKNHDDTVTTKDQHNANSNTITSSTASGGKPLKKVKDTVTGAVPGVDIVWDSTSSNGHNKGSGSSKYVKIK